MVFDGLIIPLFHEEILSEYSEVLLREKFHLDKTKVYYILNAIKLYGLEVQPHCSDEFFKDNDDKIFYEVVMEKREDNAYLVTGNKKHFPIKPFIVTPSEMIDIIENGNKK